VINIYLDTTGSMLEMGKDSALVYIAKSIEDYCNLKQLQCSFYKLDTTNISKLESIKFSNDIQLKIENIQQKSILISDGLFDFNEDTIFDLSISIGVDADLLKLKKISKKIFDNDNVLSALEYIIFKYDLLDSKIKEDEDEW